VLVHRNGALNSVPDSVELGANTSCGDAFAEHAGLSQSFAMRVPKGEDAMVSRRTTRLVNQNRELLAQITRLRLEAREQTREEWLQRARDQAARIANRPRIPSAAMQRSSVDDADQPGACTNDKR
jgi:hypothetical protein